MKIAFFFQAEDGIRDQPRSRGLGDVYKRQDESASYEGYPQNAEKVNGRWAMIGFVALLGAYITTGQIIPGIF